MGRYTWVSAETADGLPSEIYRHRCQVWTAGPGYLGKDGLDISGGNLWLPRAEHFFPDDAIMWGKYMTRFDGHPAERDKFVQRYLEKLRDLYRSQKHLWDSLLAHEEITLVCAYCEKKHHKDCHRVVMAQAMGKLGAKYMGERFP